MSRSRVVSIIIVLALANYLVFSNLLLLLFTAGSEAATRATTPRTPRVTLAPETPAGDASPEPRETPTQLPTVTPTATRSATATPAASPTPTASPTLSRTTIPLYTPPAPGAPLKYPFRYVVKQGDTLSGIAASFAVPVAKILAANGLANADLIRIGQELIIPDPNQ